MSVSHDWLETEDADESDDDDDEIDDDDESEDEDVEEMEDDELAEEVLLDASSAKPSEGIDAASIAAVVRTARERFIVYEGNKLIASVYH